MGTTPALASELLPQYEGSFGPDGTESTGFERAGPLAVDQSTHVVYVLDPGAGVLYKFDEDGQPIPFTGTAPYISGNTITGLTPFSGPGESQVAVDSISHDVYVTSGNAVTAFHADGEEAIFPAGVGAGTNQIGAAGYILGVSVDVNGDIYASDWGTSTIYIYAHSGALVTQFETDLAHFGGPGNLAVDSHGAIYVNQWLGTVTKFKPDTFPVTSATSYSAAPQPLDPNTSLTVAVDPATNDVYVADADGYAPEARIARYSESGKLLATFAGPGQEGEIATSEGIAVDGGAERIFVSNFPESGLSQVEIFGPYEGIPVIEFASVTNVTSHEATLRAAINPGGAETTYRFEYGLVDCSLAGCTSIPITAASIGDGHKTVSVSQTLRGLEPGTTYHYRVTAENEFGHNLEVEEGDHTFTTQPAALGFRFPDHRAWEMVSPPNKHGALLGGLGAPVQAAADGEAITFPSNGSIEADPEGNRMSVSERASVLARRTAGGWQSKDITVPNDEVAGVSVGVGSEYKLFSPDLSRAVLQQRSATPLSPEALGGQNIYLRTNSEPPAFRPLLTEANVPAGTRVFLSNHYLTGATPDLNRLVLASEVPLVEGAPSGPNLYLWSDGQLQAVNVLPEGGGMIPTERLGSGFHGVRHAISEDGSRVFWSTQTLTALFVRDTKSGETAQLDVPQSGASGAGAPNPVFQGADPEGSVVYFTDSQQLTVGASPDGSDLYRCEIPAGSPASGCATLTDISTPRAEPGESADVQGLIAGMSEDARTVYFVAKGVLDSTANQFGDSAKAGEPNLYVWQQGKGDRFITTLADQDSNDWGGPLSRASDVSAAASPGGRYFAFSSQRSLTGEEYLDSRTAEPVERIFRYDAAAERLVCVSCNPTGAAPNGIVGYPGTAAENRLVDPGGIWLGERVGAVLPELTVVGVSNISLYSPRVLLDNGRVFFNAIDGLVPADSNGQWDVYEYESTGVGDCSTSSGGSSIAYSAGGCVSLLSSGTGEGEAAFLDASETGDDVFFLTPAQLNEPDKDHELDVYDARVDGVPARLPSTAECLGEACQPTPQAPSDASPASAAFNGAGNVKPARKHCGKGKHRVRSNGRARCKSRKHRHRAHRASGKRRTHR